MAGALRLFGFTIEDEEGEDFAVSPQIESVRIQDVISAQPHADASQDHVSKRTSNAMLEAWEKRSKQMKPWEREMFKKYENMDPVTFTTKMNEICAKHQKRSKSYKAVKFIEPLFGALRLYFPHVTSAASASPTPAGPILGGIMCIMQISENYVQYQERIAKMLGEMGDKADILLRYELDIYQNEESLRQCLVYIYSDILEFSIACLDLLVDRKGKPNPSLRLWCLASWKPYYNKLGPIVESFKRNIQLFEEKALQCDRLRQTEQNADQHRQALVQQQELGVLRSLHRVITQGFQAYFLHQHLKEKQRLEVARRKAVLEQQRTKERLRIELMNWLPDTNYSDQFDEQTRSHMQGTGIWLFNTPQFMDWKESEQSNLLWVTGKPGCGKSVLATLVIDDLDMEKDSDIAVTFAYCKRELPEIGWKSYLLLCNIAKQLCQQTGDPERMYNEFEDINITKNPTATRLKSVISACASRFTRVYVIIDGLDECPDRDELTRFLTDLVRQPSSTVKAIIFSRPSHSIFHQEFQGYPTIEVDKGLNDDDIKTYITNTLSTESLKVKPNETKLAENKSTILSKANGMFLWVKLLLNSLVLQTTWYGIEEIVQSVPANLNGTYDLCLDRIWKQAHIDKRQFEAAYRVLLWTMNAERPLTQEEMAEAIAVDIQNRVLEEDHTMTPRSLMESCADLVTLNKDGCVVLIHASLREYLCTKHEDAGPSFQKFHTLQEQAQQVLGNVCLSYLLLERFDCGPASTQQSLDRLLESNPLLAYASKYWSFHLALSGTDTSHGSIWELVNSINRRALAMQVVEQSDEDEFANFNDTSSPLHFMALHGLAAQVRSSPGMLSSVHERDRLGRLPIDYALLRGSYEMTQLLLQLPKDVAQTANPTIPVLGQISPLHCAAVYGWPDITDILLTQGYDTEIKTLNSITPLLRAIQCGNEQVVDRLIAGKANVNCTNDDGDSALILAVAEGTMSIVEALISAKADVRIAGKNNETALHVASLIQNSRFAELLLDCGSDPNAKTADDSDQTPLHYACEKNAVDVLKLLLRRGAEADGACHGEWMPLHFCAIYGSVEAAKILIANGADWNASLKNGTIPLHLAAANNQVYFMEYLVNIKTDVNATTKFGDTALHYAAADGAVESVQFLLDRGAEKDIRNDKGHTALIDAVNEGHFNVVKKLLEYNVDATLKGVLDSPALHYAAHYGHADAIAPLLDAKADVDAVNEIGSTALHFACAQGHYEFVRRLFQLRPLLKVDLQTNSKKTALNMASKAGKLEIVQLLLDHGADVMINDEDSNLPLHLAAYGGHEEILYQLYSHSSESLHSRGFFGRTPLFMAALAGHKNLVQFLVKNGADVNGLDNDGNSPAQGTLSNGHLELAKWLLENGTNVKHENRYGWTLLHAAARADDRDTVRFLLDKNCHGLVQDTFGNTPFLVGVAANNHEIVNLLLQREINGANIIDKTGTSPLFTAIHCGDLEMLKIVIEAGADAGHIQERTGHNAFHIAAWRGRTEVIVHLLKLGVDPNRADRSNYTPLGAAADAGNPDFVKELLDLKVDVDPADTITGITPLIRAADAQAPRVVQKLLYAGADIAHRDSFGKNAVDYGQWHTPTMEVLRQASPQLEPIGLEARKERFLYPFIRRLLQILINPRTLSALDIEEDRRDCLRFLGLSLASLNEPSLDKSAGLCLSEHCFCDQRKWFQFYYSCFMCGLQMKTTFYICRVCYFVFLCEDCYNDYNTGDGTVMSVPKNYKELIILEKRIWPLREKLRRALLVSPGFAVLSFFYFEAMRTWTEELLEEYKKWEENYDKDSKFLSIRRPGQEFLKLMKESQMIVDKLIEDEPGSNYKDALTELGKKLTKIDQFNPSCSEFRELVCSGHDYMKINQEAWKAANRDGYIDSTTEKLTNDWLAKLQDSIPSLEEESEGQIEISTSTLDREIPFDIPEVQQKNIEDGLQLEIYSRSSKRDNDVASAGAQVDQQNPEKLARYLITTNKGPELLPKARRVSLNMDERILANSDVRIATIKAEKLYRWPDAPVRASTFPFNNEKPQFRRRNTAPLISSALKLPRRNSLPANDVHPSIATGATYFLETASQLPKITEQEIEQSPPASPIQNQDENPLEKEISSSSSSSINLEDLLSLPDLLEVDLTTNETNQEKVREVIFSTTGKEPEDENIVPESVKSVKIKFDEDDMMDLLLLSGLRIIEVVKPDFPVEYFRRQKLDRIAGEIIKILEEQSK